MRPLRFNFMPRPASSHWPRWILLAVGMAMLGTVTVYHQRLDDVRGQLLDQLASLRRSQPHRSVIAAMPPSQELGAATALQKQFKRPWDALFAGIEQARYKGVDLTSLQVDVVRGEVVIQGLAHSLEDANVYLRRLEQSGVLRDVHLTQHDASAIASPSSPTALPPSSVAAGNVHIEVRATWHQS